MTSKPALQLRGVDIGAATGGIGILPMNMGWKPMPLQKRLSAFGPRMVEEWNEKVG